MNEVIIKLEKLNKDFKVLNRREGIKGGLKDLFSKDYKIISAVKDVSLEIQKGEIVGFLGPNGAGKSTTIKMMTGILEPTSGTILVDGLKPHDNRTKNSKNIGVVFGQRSQLWWSLPLIESLKILKDIYQVSNKDFEDMLELYNKIVNIKELYSKPIRQMSLGQRTLSDILAAFLHNPSIIYLDEPTIGLDVSMKSKIRDLIKVLNKEKGTTVILTTHDIGDVDALCKRIVIIDRGTILFDNSITNLKQFFGDYRNIKLRLINKNEEIKEDFLEEVTNSLKKEFNESFTEIDSLQITHDDEWVNILFKENEISMMEILNFIQNKRKIYDMNLEEISTESVIKKIYEGDIEDEKISNPV